MYADSTNTALCRQFSLVCVSFFPSVQIPFDGCPEIHMHHPSHLRISHNLQKTTRPITEPTITQEREKKEEEKKKNTTQRLLPVKSSRTLIACFVLCQHAITYKQHRTCTICL